MIVLRDLPAQIERSLEYGPATDDVPIFQHAWEFERLLELYRMRPPWHVLEVGTYHGGTLYHWLQNAQEGALVVSVDSYQAGVDNRALYEEWAPEGVGVRTIAGDSHAPETVRQAGLHAPYDWLFIDAGHLYEEVKADWESYGPMVAPGGIVAFHDILPPTAAWPEIEVERLWREIQAQGYVTQELVADAGAEWGGIGVVYL